MSYFGSRILLASAAFVLIAGALPIGLRAAPPEFIGNVQIEQDQSDHSGKTWTVLSDLKFVNTDGKAWVTQKGDKTDGASIPWYLWTLIGSPFTGPYVRAALIHDHYCQEEHRVRTWQETHNMFYDAMIAGGVGSTQANIFYYGVYKFGPKWANLAPGVPCGRNCVRKAPVGGAQNFESTQNDDAATKDIDTTAKLIEQRAAAGNPMTREEIQKRADDTGADPFDAKGNFIR